MAVGLHMVEVELHMVGVELYMEKVGLHMEESKDNMMVDQICPTSSQE